MTLNNFHCYDVWSAHTAYQPVDQKKLSLQAFHMAAATVTYAILSITSSQSWQMANVQTEGILYKKKRQVSLESRARL